MPQLISSSVSADHQAKFVNPQEIISKLNMEQGMVVADFGCGAGYFTLAAARKIGEDGKVYSFDILPQKLEAVESQAKSSGLTNIITKRANLENENGSRLAPESVDWVIMKDMLFQNKGKDLVLTEARRVLKTGGRALAIEWRPEDLSVGPDKELRISKEALSGLAQRVGLAVEKEVEVGDFHYGLVFVK